MLWTRQPFIQLSDGAVDVVPSLGQSQKPRVISNGADEGPDSEAETLIDSPVKRREAERENNAVRSDRPVKSTCGR